MDRKRFSNREKTIMMLKLRSRGRSIRISVFIGMFWCLGASVSPARGEPAGRPVLFDRVEKFRLDNGMRFLLLPRHDVPIVAGNIMVKVGNVDTPEGSTGLAHVFEHMAFKGTDVIGSTDFTAESALLDSLVEAGERLSSIRKGRDTAASEDSSKVELEVAALEERAGRFSEPMAFPRTYDTYTFDFNAYTSTDVTAYTALLGANNLEVWMLMESERLQNPVFREFYSELEVVMEERRANTDDKPEAGARELLKSLFFTKHPYRFPTIGFMDDLRTLTPKMLREFFDRYYAPGNMVGALVGDFDPAEARTWLTSYFGDIPSRPLPPGIDTVEPIPTSPRRGVYRQGKERRLQMAFPGFGPTDPDRPVAELLGGVLAGDRTRRLTRRLDLEEGVARDVRVSPNGGFDRYPGYFLITVDVMAGHTNEEAEELVREELRRLVEEPVTAEKLDEIRSAWRKSFLFGLQKNADLADLLAFYETIDGDWRLSYRRFDDYDRVTPADVSRLAGELFQPKNATVVYLEPEEASGEDSDNKEDRP